MRTNKTLKSVLLTCCVALGGVSTWAQSLGGYYQTFDTGLKYTIKTVYNTPSSTKINTVSVSQTAYSTAPNATAELSIPQTISFSVKGEDTDGQTIDKYVTFNVVEVADEGFQGNTTLTSVVLPESVTEIGDNAFEDCENLASVAFGSKVKNIGSEAFKGASKLTTVTFPNTGLGATEYLTISAGAFENTAIVTLDLTNAKLQALNKLFEKNNTTLRKVILPASLTSLATNALADCIQLSEVDFLKCTNLETIGNYSLGNTIIESLDLSKTKLTDFSAVTPFVTDEIVTNSNLKSVVLSTNVTKVGTAFANCAKLTTINLNTTKLTEVVNEAFANDIALMELSFPATVKTITDSPFQGCENLATLNIDPTALLTVGTSGVNLYGSTTSALKTLNIKNSGANNVAAAINANAFGNEITAVEIGNITGGTIAKNAITLSSTESSTVKIGKFTGSKALVASSIVGTNVKTATVGEITQSLPLSALGQQIEILNFTGDIKESTSGLTAFAAENKLLATVNFNSIEMKEEVVKAGVFGKNTPNLKNVTWTPASNKEVKAFVQTAFATTAQGENAQITLTTTTGVAQLYGYDENNLYNVKFVAGAPAPEGSLDPIAVAGISGGKFYGKFYYAGGNAYIEKKNDDATVVVYAAYLDEADQALYMDPLKLDNGRYIVAAGQAVVICSTTADIVTPVATSELSTMRYQQNADGSYTVVNDLKYTDDILSSDYIGKTYPNKAVYVMANPAVKGLYWQKLSSTQYVPEKGLYFVSEPTTSSSPLRVVFLDENGDEEATFINGVEVAEPAVENGVIYNLQGIRVDESYKGIVIKNGKKFLQK